MVKIPEPHMPPENPEYYSYMTLPRNSRVFFVDDEITSGEVVKNTSQALRQDLNTKMVGVGVALESSPAARARLEQMKLPYASLDQLNEGDLAAADRKNSPTLIPFREAIPIVPRIEAKKSGKSAGDIHVEFLKMQNGAVFVDHPFRGMTLSLDPDLSDQVGERIAEELEGKLGSLSALRKKYYEKGRTLFMVGTTPSGILGALPASRVTRLPLIGAMNRPEPKDYDQLNISDVVNYIGLDGYAYSMFGLTAGDGIFLVTGELTDGEEQIRIIQSLKQKGIDVLGVVSLTENTRYNGRKRIEETGVSVSSLQPYQAKENIQEVNVTDRSWAALKYAVMLLEAEIKKINPAAHLDSIRVLPSSLTGNSMISASDLDEAYIWVDGLSQFQLEQLQPVFNQWLESGGFKFDSHSNKAPILLSLWHRESNEKTYELHHFPHIEIYHDGQFYPPEALVKSGVLPMRKVQSKNLARLKWFYSLNEISMDFLKGLLALAVKSGKWPQGRIKVLRDLIDNLPRERLSAASLECLHWIDREYLAGTRDLAIPQEKSEAFRAALPELVQKGILRIYGNKILLVTRHGTVIYSDRFWKDQIRILGQDDFLKSVEDRWRMSTPEYRMIAEQYSAAIIKKWDRETPRLLPELVMRSWIDRIAPLTSREKERWFESFECDDALIFATTLEAGEKREAELKEFLRRKILAILYLPEEKNGSLHAYSGNLQVQLHLSLNMMFRWMRQRQGAIDDDIRFILDAIINNPQGIRIPSMVLQDITVYFAGVYERIADDVLKRRVYRFIRDQKGSFKYRSSQLGGKAYKTIIEKSPEDVALLSPQPSRVIVPAAVQDEEREKIFHAIEQKRTNGQPIEFLASDWDGSLVAFSSGQESRLSPEMAFWFNWLMSKGKQIVITTAASYSRFYRQTMDPGSNPVPLVKSKNLNVFNDTVAYLNDRPIPLRKFTPNFLEQLHAIMEKRGWHFLDDGRPPQLAFWHEALSRDEAVREAEAIKSLLPQGNNFYLTLSKFRKDEWIIKLYYETKERIYQTPLANGEKIQPGRTLVMGDDAGPMGNDEPLFRGATDGLKIALGEEIFSGAMTMQTKNKEGALLAIEAWVVSTLIDEASQELLPLEEKLQELAVMIDGTPGLSPEVSERMKKNIGGLLARVRSEMRVEEPGKVTEEDLIRKAVTENPSAVLPTPVYFLELHPTNQCNLRCKDCIAGKRDHAFVFPFDQLEKVGALKPSEILVIGGGEPTIYRDGKHNFNDYILKLAAVAPQANIGLGTNGVYVPKGDWTNKIKWVSVSLHGTSQDRFLGFTGRDKFDQVWRNIFQEYALKSPIEEIKISFVYTKENLKEVLPLLEKIREAWTAVEAELAKKGIKKRFWFYLQAEAVDHGPDRPFAILNLDDESKRIWTDAVEKMHIEKPLLWAFIQEHCPWISAGPLKERKSEPVKLCYMVTNYLLIAASGLIYPCCVMPASAPQTNLGHITQSLEALLRRRMKFMFALPKRCRIGCHIGNTLSGKTVKRLLLEPANAANPDSKIENVQTTNTVPASTNIFSDAKQADQTQATVDERENRSEARVNAVDLAQQNKDLIDRLFYAKKDVLDAEDARIEMAKRGMMLLEQFSIKKKLVIGAIFRMRVQEVLGSRILLAVSIPSVARATYYSYAFGNVDLLVLPNEQKTDGQWLANTVLDESMVKQLPPSVFPKIFQYLDFGQRLNLQTLNFILDYPWNASSPDVYERELAQLRKYRNEAPLGRLITDREMFPTDRDGNLYALHITSGKSAILASANKEMHTTPHAVGPVIYATPLIRNGLKPLSESAKPVSLAEDVWKNLSVRREISHDENVDNYGLVIRVPYQGTSANRLTNWIDYFGFGRAELETYYRFRSRPEWTPAMDSMIRNEVVRQYNSSFEFLRKTVEDRKADAPQDWVTFWRAFKEARGNMPILNHVFYEVLKSYISLFQNDSQSFAMRDEGNMNVGPQYQVLFEVDPKQRLHFSTQRFAPEMDVLLASLAKHIRSFSPEHFKAYVMERFPMFIAVKFLEGENLSGPVDRFEDLADQHPNFAGLLHYNATYDKLLETSSALKYEYQLVFSQVLRDVFRRRHLLVPIFGMMVPTGELGVWQMGDEDIKIFDLHFDLPRQISPLTIGKPLDIHITRDKTIRDEDRGLSYKGPLRTDAIGVNSGKSDKSDLNSPNGGRSEIRNSNESVGVIDQPDPLVSRFAPVHRISDQSKADRIIRMVMKSAQPATVFVNAEDFQNLSVAQKREYLIMALSNKSLRVVVYNERGQVQDRELAALLKLDHVERTDRDLGQAVGTFSRSNVPAIHLSKNVLPSQTLVGSLRRKVAFFKANGSKSGTLATALLWAISGGETVHFSGVKEEDGFWTVEETLLDSLQRTYDNNFVIAVAA
jgi:MoaA/NifB/PqqE/SkfB family radical SAM enzyme/adenine/guanine phosphoribosyltransferase-like PRPP-binding protein